MRARNEPTIWIVEDDPDICCLFSDILLEFGNFMVVCVDDAANVAAKQGDLIFLDIHGTKSSRLKANDARVVTMSGDGEIEPELAKPFQYSHIENLVKEFISKRRSGIAA